MAPKVPGGGEGRPWKRRQFFSFQRGKYGTTMVYPQRNLRRLLAWILLVILAIAGLYFLIWHKDPLPGNHEAIGLGTLHVLHGVIGIALLAVAGYLWYRVLRRSSALRPQAR